MDSPRGNITQDPQNVALQHPGGGQDEGEHPVEKQSLYKRVKAKAKRMKESFKGQGHEHDHDLDKELDDVDVDDENVDGGHKINLDDHAASGKEGITSQHETNISGKAASRDQAPVSDLSTYQAFDPTTTDYVPGQEETLGGSRTDIGKEGITSQHETNISEKAASGDQTPVSDLDTYQAFDPTTTDYVPGQEETLGGSRTDTLTPLGSENQPNDPTNTPVIGQSTGSQSTGGIGFVQKPKLGGILEKDHRIEEDVHPAKHQAEVTDATPGGYGSTTTQDIELEQGGETPRHHEGYLDEGTTVEGASHTPVSKPDEYQTFDTNTSTYIPGEEETLGRSRTDTGGPKLSEEQPDGPENTPVLDHRGHYHTGVSKTGETEVFGKYQDRPSILEKEFHASREAEAKLHAGNNQTEVTDPTGRGGEEIVGTPIVHELGKMNIHDESSQTLDPNVKTRQQENQNISTLNHDQFSAEAVTEPQLDATVPISQGFHDEREQKHEVYNDKVSHEAPTAELGKMNIHDESTQNLDSNVESGQQERQNISTTGNHDHFSPEAVIKPQHDATIPISQGFHDEKEQKHEVYNDEVSHEAPTTELGKLNIHDESTQKLDSNVESGQQERQNISTTGNHDHFSPEAVIKPQHDATIPISQGFLGEKEQEPESYNDKVSHETPTDADSTVSFDQQSDQEPLEKKPVAGGYGETVSNIPSSITNTAALAKDDVASKLGYGKTHEESGSEYQTGSTDSSFNKEALVTEDKSLSNTINEALPLHKAKEESPIDEATEAELGEDKKVVVKGKVTESEEVANSLGKAEDTNYDDAGPGLASPGKSVMDRLRDAAGSWFNQSGGEAPVKPQAELGDGIEEGNDRTQASNVKEIGLH